MKTNSTLAAQKKLVKTGMVAALGVLAGTGFMGHAFSRRGAHLARFVHVAAGVAMVGLSCWHWSLYRNKAEERDAAIRDDAPVQERGPDAEQASELEPVQVHGQERAGTRDKTRSKTSRRTRKKDDA